MTAWTGRWEDQWEELRDPGCFPAGRHSTCNININEGLWGHNCYKHLNDPGQPWDALLGPQLSPVARSLAMNNGLQTDKADILRQIAEALKKEVQRSLDRPLALVFELYQRTTAKATRKWLCQRWVLVLPSGALFQVKRTVPNAKNVFAETCYFPDVGQQPVGMQWIKVVEALVLAFASRKGGQLTIREYDEAVLPGPGRKGVSHRDQAGREVDVEAQKVRFVITESWGFGGGTEPQPWRRSSVPPWE